MPVHDGMHTHALAGQLLRKLPEGSTYRAKLQAVQDKAFEGSKLTASAAVDFFEVLNELRRIPQTPTTRVLYDASRLAEKIYSGPYNAEIA